MNKKLIKYIFLSVIPFGIDLLIYYLLVEYFDFSVYIGFIIAFLVGSLVAFLISPFIFKNKIDFKKYYLNFLFIEIFVLFIGEFLLIYIFIEYLFLNYLIAKIISVGIVFLLSFVLKNKLLSK